MFINLCRKIAYQPENTNYSLLNLGNILFIMPQTPLAGFGALLALFAA